MPPGLPDRTPWLPTRSGSGIGGTGGARRRLARSPRSPVARRVVVVVLRVVELLGAGQATLARLPSPVPGLYAPVEAGLVVAAAAFAGLRGGVLVVRAVAVLGAVLRLAVVMEGSRWPRGGVEGNGDLALPMV